ncbi:hypothetical protein [Lactobacillus sp. Sy-1]|uniref:hypothetical protein n=1 Tax=Lactobacillus sp. Sy-1 TaxID=2109645 RepID=UPI001C5B6EE1|nr:hypothetical protein [Lactobacillus sp. Sy-1]MBW1606104.1 hypothetical protein [Lactobacillus sp. Sy-1]
MKLTKRLMPMLIAIPLMVTPFLSSTANANAATTKTTFKDYVVVNTKFYKQNKPFTAKSSHLTSYQAAFMADEPVVSLGKAKSVKLASRKVTVDQKIVVKISSASVNTPLKNKQKYKLAKQTTFLHVKKVGWVNATNLTKS